MPSYQVKASLHKWPGSFDDQAVRVEITQEVQANDTYEAWRMLDKIIEEKKNELEKQGFRTRIIWSEVKGK